MQININNPYIVIEDVLLKAWSEGQIEQMGLMAFQERLSRLEAHRIIADYDDVYFEKWASMTDVRESLEDYIPDGYVGSIRIRPNSKTFHYKVKRVGGVVTLTDDYID